VSTRDFAEEGIPVFVHLEGAGEGGRIARRAGELARDRGLGLEAALQVLGEAEWEGGDEGPYVRAINFHNTGARRLGEIAAQLEAAAGRYAPLDLAGLHARLGDAALHAAAPAPVLPVFYEGYRTHYDHALGLLERTGLVGWFVVPTGFIDTPPAHQAAFARAHWLGPPADEHGDGRHAMTWDELREVAARGHVVTCHTATHCAAADVLTEEDARRELHESRARLEEELGREVRTLTWLLGTAFGEDPEADRRMLAAGYDTVIAATRIQRIA
jgi:polysaccharide deacetylase